VHRAAQAGQAAAVALKPADLVCAADLVMPALALLHSQQCLYLGYIMQQHNNQNWTTHCWMMCSPHAPAPLRHRTVSRTERTTAHSAAFACQTPMHCQLPHNRAIAHASNMAVMSRASAQSEHSTSSAMPQVPSTTYAHAASIRHTAGRLHDTPLLRDSQTAQQLHMARVH
jgi:hypothetical protein